MVAVVPADRAEEAAQILRDGGETVHVIGRISEGGDLTYRGALL